MIHDQDDPEMVSAPSITNSAGSSGKPEQILVGAMQVFLQYGYAGTSMDRVAAIAKVSKHTIYNHFHGKEGLFVALFERLVLRHFQVEFGCELLPTDPPDQVLYRLASILLDRMNDPEYIAFVRLLFAESGRFPELAQLYWREVINKGDEVLGRYLHAHPELKLVNPTTTAQIFWGALTSYIFSQEVLHGKQLNNHSNEQFIQTLIDLILKSSP